MFTPIGCELSPAASSSSLFILQVARSMINPVIKSAPPARAHGDRGSLLTSIMATETDTSRFDVDADPPLNEGLLGGPGPGQQAGFL